MNSEALDVSRQARPTATTSAEHADLLQTLAIHRGFLRCTVNGLTDAQAALTPTASALSLGGLIKHVSLTEQAWTAFIVGGADGMQAVGDLAGDWSDGFRMVGAETLSGLLDAYDLVARHTTDVVASLNDLNGARRLPEAPWFEPGASWTARRVVLHIIAETSQHAGHADIIRESIDGAKTMG
jgi:uncharacterized damage-inducible protein DinB